MPPAPPKKRRTALIVTLAAVAAVLLVAADIAIQIRWVYDAANAPATGETASPSESPSPTGGPLSAHGTDLKTYMMPAPASSHRWKTKPPDQVLDLAGAAAFSSDPTGSADALRRYEFERGFVRRWVTNQGTFVELRLLQFASPDDALEYYDVFESANRASWGDESDVPGIESATSFVKPDKKDGYQGTLSIAQAGDIVAIVKTDQLPPAVASIGNAILVTEYARL